MDMQRTRNKEESEKLWSILYPPTHCKCCVIAIPNLDTWKWNPKRTQKQIACLTDSSLPLQFQHLVGRLHIANRRSFKRMVAGRGLANSDHDVAIHDIWNLIFACMHAVWLWELVVETASPWRLTNFLAPCWWALCPRKDPVDFS
jgi:hypothetical protein